MNYRRPIIILGSLVVASIVAIALLAFLSKKLNDKKNGFNRHLLTTTLQVRKQLVLPVKPNRIIGSQAGELYLQGSGAYEFYKTDTELDSFSMVSLPLEQDLKLRTGVVMFL